MISFIHRQIKRRRERGQILITFVLFLVVLILFVGLGVDVGFAYITKAHLSKAVDASALVGVRNLMDAQVETIVRSAFAMNYGRPGRDTAAVVPTVTIVTDPTSNTRRLRVSATATINTFFIRILPMWKTLSVSSSAETQRGRAILSLVLDRSGSMGDNGGWSALPPGVDTFIDLFDDTIDRAALITYGTTVRVDLPMTQPFRAQVKNLVPRNKNQYTGATFSHGGLEAGFTQILSAPIQAGENVTRAAIFFTDGYANIIQVTTNCPPVRTLLIGGLKNSSASQNSYHVYEGASELCRNQSGSRPDCCNNLTHFPHLGGGTNITVNGNNIYQEARDRAVDTARRMQREGIFVYSIGYGSVLDTNFLRQVANDPLSPTYNSNLPSGKALIVPSTQALREAFQIVAASVLERLTQ